MGFGVGDKSIIDKKFVFSMTDDGVLDSAAGFAVYGCVSTGDVQRMNHKI